MRKRVDPGNVLPMGATRGGARGGVDHGGMDDDDDE